MFKLNIKKGNYGYSTRIKNVQNEQEVSMFMNVQFAKCEEPTDEALQVNITDCFMSCYGTQDGFVKPKLVIKQYEVLNVYENNTSESQSNEESSVDLDINLDLGKELPF